MTYRTYHAVAGEDRSRLGEQVAEQRERVARNLTGVKQVLLVISGKGGVGKTHVACGLARALAARGSRTGVLDADLHSPTVPGMLRVTEPLSIGNDRVIPATSPDDVAVVSTGLLLETGQPLRWRDSGPEDFVWRSNLVLNVVREFLGDVEWGELDHLIVDLPPGTDTVGDIATLMPEPTGAIAVTIPTSEARASVERAMHSARDRGVGLLGVVENMAGYVCDSCGTKGPLFPGAAGLELSRAFSVPLLATIPFRGDGLPGAEFEGLAAVITGES